MKRGILMHLIEFINMNENWEELLQNEPYKLNIKWHENYFICTYNMLESDFSMEEVHEARGSIFVFDKTRVARTMCVIRFISSLTMENNMQRLLIGALPVLLRRLTAH